MVNKHLGLKPVKKVTEEGNNLHSIVATFTMAAVTVMAFTLSEVIGAGTIHMDLGIEKGKTPFEVKYTTLNLEGYTPISSKSGHISFLWRFSN